MAIAATSLKQFEGTRYVIYEVTFSGTESAEELAFIDASTLTHPNGQGAGQAEGVIPVLVEASWSLPASFSRIDLCYHDEGGDEIVISMSGDGTYDATGFGGGALQTLDADEGRTEADFDMLFDAFEGATEDATTGGQAQFVFKKRNAKL